MRAKFGSDPTVGSKILFFKFISRYVKISGDFGRILPGLKVLRKHAVIDDLTCPMVVNKVTCTVVCADVPSTHTVSEADNSGGSESYETEHVTVKVAIGENSYTYRSAPPHVSRNTANSFLEYLVNWFGEIIAIFFRNLIAHKDGGNNLILNYCSPSFRYFLCQKVYQQYTHLPAIRSDAFLVWATCKTRTYI